jgi:hypothetical protein
LRDGDTDETKAGDPDYAGHWFLNASTYQKPEIIDKARNHITSEDDFYSGVYGRTIISFYPFNEEGSKGIGVGLGNMQKLKDGEHLGGSRSSAESDFNDDFELDDDGDDEDF